MSSCDRFNGWERPHAHDPQRVRRIPIHPDPDDTRRFLTLDERAARFANILAAVVLIAVSAGLMWWFNR